MKKTIILFLAGIIVNCASPGMGPEGFIFTNSKIGFYGNQISNSNKKGESCSHSVLGLIAFGDSSINSAATNGGINKVNSLNFSTFSILGIHASLCAEVNGN